MGVLKIVLIISIAVAAFAYYVSLPYPHESAEDLGVWKAPIATDSRSPCPILNSLANHGYLPRDGKGITASMFAHALENALNMDTAFSNLLGYGALGVLTRVSVDLVDLGKHNVLEHDASLTRVDAYFGNQTVLNRTLLGQFINQSKNGKFLDPDDVGEYQKIRQTDSKSHNPEYSFGWFPSTVAAGEPALFLRVFGDKGGAADDTSYYTITIDDVNSIFGKEELPKGWVRKIDSIGVLDPTKILERIKSHW